MQATSEGLDTLNNMEVHLLGFMCVASFEDNDPEILEGPNGKVSKFTISVGAIVLANLKVPFTYNQFVLWAQSEKIFDFEKVVWARDVFDKARKFLMIAAERKQEFILHFSE